MAKKFKKCETCNGTGAVHSHNPTCWDCRGTGKILVKKEDKKLKKYCVTVQEMCDVDVIVMADSPAQARMLVEAGEGVWGARDHEETLPSADWEVEEQRT